MTALSVTTKAGRQSTLDYGVVEKFGSRLGGDLIRPTDPTYDEVRKIWNGMIDKRPAMIARCVGVADVIEAVGFARENNLLLSVRGGVTTSPARPSVTEGWS